MNLILRGIGGDETLTLGWAAGGLPKILMSSPLFFTEMNHHAAPQNPSAKSNVGLVTLNVRKIVIQFVTYNTKF